MTGRPFARLRVEVNDDWADPMWDGTRRSPAGKLLAQAAELGFTELQDIEHVQTVWRYCQLSSGETSWFRRHIFEGRAR